ncbi:unnamed protein product [Rotaria sp. Silwood1]|nr:unnamed protein product [Rotaria sp. Silwood1]
MVNGISDIYLPSVQVYPKDPPFHLEKNDEHTDDVRKVIEADLTVGIPLYQCLTPRCPDDNCNKEIIEQPVNLSTLTQTYIDNDRRFIQRSVEKQTLFFLYLPLSHMHVPHDYVRQFKDTSALPSIYGDTSRELDYHSAQCDLAGNQGLFTDIWQASPIPFGGGGGGTAKFTTWEAGHRVPSIPHWTGIIKSGNVTNAIGSHLDMMPTIPNLAGFTLPSNRSFDEIDLNHNGTLSAVRYNQYKAYYTTYSKPCGACGGKEGLVMYHKPSVIFDLSHDLAESTSIVVSQLVYDAIDRALREKFIAVKISDDKI